MAARRFVFACAPGARDEFLAALKAGEPVALHSSALLSAFVAAGLPCDRFGYGGADYHKTFLLDEHDRLSEYNE